MNKAVPWSIKGVDFDARTAAKDAARRAGMTLGEWLNSVIAEQAAEQGMDPDDIGEDGRVDAVRSRLERMSAGAGRRRNDRTPRARYLDDDFEQDEDFSRRPARRLRPQTAAREVSWNRERYENDFRGGAESFLDEAVQSFERRSRRESAETNAALDHVARRLESLEGRLSERSAEPESERTLKRVISRLESRIEALAAREDTDYSREASPRVEAHFAAPAAAPAVTPVSPPVSPPVAPPVAAQAAPVARPPAPPAAANPMRSSELARIEAKLNRLLERETLPAARYASQAAAAPAGRGGMADAIAEINRRQADLDRPFARPEVRMAAQRAPGRAFEQPAVEAPLIGAPIDPVGDQHSEIRQTVSTLKNEIADLSRHIDGLRREAAQPDAIARRVREAIPAATDPVPALEGLRRQIADMGDVIARLAPREGLTSLEAALRDLSEQVRQTRRDGVGEEVLEPVERLVRDLKRAIEDFAPQTALTTIERELQAINRNIEGMGRSNVDAEQFERACAQTEEIRNLLAAAVARPAPLENVEKQISALARRVDLIASRGMTPVGVSAVNQSVGEIRSAMEEATLAPLMSALEERIEELSRKIDAAAARPAPANPKLDEISQRLDDMHKTLSQTAPQPAPPPGVRPEQLDVIAKRLDAMQQTINWQAERQPTAKVDTSSLEGMLAQIMDRLAQPQTPAVAVANVPELDGFEKTLRDLAQRVDAMSRQPESDMLLGLEERLSDISSRLDRASTPEFPIGGLERTLTQLASQLEDSRLNAMDAASNAARYAAQDVLEEFRRSQAEGEPASLDYARELIAKEIGSLRSLQDASDRRTHATLGAVHETLEKVVDRLAMLEEEITERDDAPGQPSHAAIPAAPMARVEAPAAAPQMSAATASSAPDADVLASGPAPVFARPAAPTMPAAQSAPEVKAPAPTPDAARMTAPEIAPLGNDRRPSAAAVSSPLDTLLIEPGSGKRPGRATPADDSAEEFAQEERGSSSFIAAARRAQQAAQAQAEREAAAATQQQGQSRGLKAALSAEGGALAEARSRAKAAASMLSLRKTKKGDAGKEDSGKAGRPDADADTAAPPAKRGLFSSRKVLFSIAGLVLVLGALTILRQNMARTEAPRPNAAITAPKSTESAAVQRPAPVPVSAPAAPTTSLLTPTPSAAPANGFSANPPAAAKLTGPESAPTASPAPESATDRAPVSSIPTFAAGRPASSGMNLHSEAAAGNSHAQYELAVRLGDGREQARDPAAAAQWLQKAAQKGLAPAQYRLGSLYEKGIGVQKDLQQARHWYEQAASAGNVKAMHNLAVLLAEGGEARPDYVTAANWFKRAAEHGVRDSQYNLAILYARGMGVEQSLTEAYVWLALAEAQGDTDAGAKKGDVGKRLTPQQLTEVSERVQRFRTHTAIGAANDVPSPPGGWRAEPAPAADATKAEPPRAPAKRAKVSAL